jgi:hypothetical protein
MAFREKSAWISLLTTIGIWGAYYWGEMHRETWHLIGLLGAIVAAVVVQVVLHIALAAAAPKEASARPDEREMLIDLKAVRAAYAALSFGVVCVCLWGTLGLEGGGDARVLMATLVVAEVVRSSSQLIQHRRGA